MRLAVEKPSVTGVCDDVVSLARIADAFGKHKHQAMEKPRDSTPFYNCSLPVIDSLC